MRIAINGLGRIGRAVIRGVFENKLSDIEIVAANGTSDIQEYAHLLKYDSIHGTFFANIIIEGDYLVIENQKIRIISQKEPATISWSLDKVDIVFECTGKFNKKDEASKHLAGGAKKVIVSAPCDNADITIIYGVNQQNFLPQHQIISAGSCTTNALATIAKIMNDHIGIDSGFMTTIHSYTNDQNLLDGTHKDRRRARACAMSMIPTSTGAAKTIGLVIPELNGKLAGSAIRVPTPNVSLIDFTFNAKKETTAEEINAIVENATNNNYKDIVGYAKTQLVSIDYNHSSYSSIFDPFETSVIAKKLCRVISWYDNEWAFAMRMLDIAKYIL